MAKALGLLEVYGFSTALYAIDAACKATDVTVEALDKNRPATSDPLPAPLLIMIKFRGSVGDVTTALEVGKEVANTLTGCTNTKIITGPDEGLDKFIQISCIK